MEVKKKHAHLLTAGLLVGGAAIGSGAVYAASKTGVLHLRRTLFQELPPPVAAPPTYVQPLAGPSVVFAQYRVKSGMGIAVQVRNAPPNTPIIITSKNTYPYFEKYQPQKVAQGMTDGAGFFATIYASNADMIGTNIVMVLNAANGSIIARGFMKVTAYDK